VCLAHFTVQNEVVIVSAVRTPIGSILSAFSDVPGVQLAAVAIKGYSLKDFLCQYCDSCAGRWNKE
jgi:hypothetical protein